MVNFLSPGVAVQENVLNASFPQFATSSAAIVGSSPIGPLAITLVTTPAQFLQQYCVAGMVQLGNYFQYSAMAYLSQGTQLYTQRVVHSDALYAGARIKTSVSAQPNAALLAGAATTSFVPVSGNQDLFEVFNCNPGVWGDNVAIQVNNVNSLTNQFEIDVFFTNPYTGVNTQVESWVVSRNVTALDGYGNPLYMVTKINGYSAYIVVADNTNYAYTVLPKGQGTNLFLGGGNDGSAVTDSDIALAWPAFTNKQNYDVRILINSGYTGSATQSAMLAVVDSRQDCMGIFDHPYQNTILSSSTVATNVVTFRTSTQNFNDQRAVLYSPWLRINDSWNSQQVFVPPSGYVAAAYAYNDYVSDVWMSPAGFTRGSLNVLGTSTVYSQGDRDLLYENQINPIQTFRGSGIIIYGDKNLVGTPEAYLQQFLFQNNTPLTRTIIQSGILSYLSGLYAQGAFNPIGPTGQVDLGYAVVCNTTNNTPTTIAAHQLFVDVYVRPAQSINFILLRMNVMDSQVSITTLAANGTLL